MLCIVTQLGKKRGHWLTKPAENEDAALQQERPPEIPQNVCLCVCRGKQSSNCSLKPDPHERHSSILPFASNACLRPSIAAGTTMWNQSMKPPKRMMANSKGESGKWRCDDEKGEPSSEAQRSIARERTYGRGRSNHESLLSGGGRVGLHVSVQQSAKR